MISTRTVPMSSAVWRWLLSGLIAVVMVVSVGGVVRGQDGSIRLTSFSVTSEFPDGFRIRLEAAADKEIVSAQIRLKVGQRTHGTVDTLCQVTPEVTSRLWRCIGLEPGRSIEAELFWRTFGGGAYIPPGTVISYSFAIENSDGNVLETDPKEFVYHHPGFDWEEVSEGPVTVAYHGPIKSRAETILQTILTTMDKMAPVLGAEIIEPIRVTIFNNRLEMLEAQQTRSNALSRRTQTLGQASNEEGVLVMVADRNSEGTASHEVTHILTHRAGDSVFRRVPAWLDEGLSEYGNVEPGFEYDIALDFAVETGSLLPFMYMALPPGDPEQLIIFYGQGRSVVRLMIYRWGEEKMRELMEHHKRSGNIDRALQDVYEVSLAELENLWREEIGAEPFVAEDIGRVLPTPLPQRTLGLFSLTPQPDSELIGSRVAEPTATPPPPEPIAQPTPEPVPSGSRCGALSAGAGALDPSAFLLLAGLVGLGLRRRL